MSTLETNAIGKYSTNNVSIDDALNLKSYTTTQRDALTSVAGDMIYNTTDNKVQVYTGSAWEDLGGVAAFKVQSLTIGGGGGGGGYNGYIPGYNESASGGGGGGAGGYRNTYASENTGGGGSTETPMFLEPSTNYTVTVGAGGAAPGSHSRGNDGSQSIFVDIYASGGGGGGRYQGTGRSGASSGGGGGHPFGGYSAGSILSNPTQGHIGGNARTTGNGIGGGGGGAGSVGQTAPNTTTPGDGGDGLSSSITGTATTRAGGGGGGASANYTGGTGGSGGGGDGGKAGGTGNAVLGTSATVNTGSGGGAAGGNGGSGVVILRWATADATIGGTRTGLIDGGVQTDGDDSYIVFTEGTGTITFS
jgi:hypothetical protein